MRANVVVVVFAAVLASACGGNPVLEAGRDAGKARDAQPPCTPSTCEELGSYCGFVDDGCGTEIDCGSCGANQTCSGGVCICTRESDAAMCARLALCGATTARDNCGQQRAIDCGRCDCTHESDPEMCLRLGRSCGQVAERDNCGTPREVSCGGCAPGMRCVDGTCASTPDAGTNPPRDAGSQWPDGGCQLGQLSCSGTYLTVCGPNGWITGPDCFPGTCSGGQCVGRDGGYSPDAGGCRDGEVICMGNAIYACWAGDWNYAYGCAADQVCSAGRCLGGSSDGGYKSDASVCRDGEVTCMGNAIYACWAGSWNYAYGCAWDQVCSAGRCLGGSSDAGYTSDASACRDGERSCMGNAVYACWGGGWFYEYGCAGYCSAGACVGADGGYPLDAGADGGACTPWDTTCFGNDVYVCSSGGWTYQSSCGPGQYCQFGTCYGGGTDGGSGDGGQCWEGERTCFGNDVYSCWSGTWYWDHGCAGGSCSAGACYSNDAGYDAGPGPDAGTCVTGELSCSGNTVLSCWYGSWYIDHDCGPGQYCAGGYCYGSAIDAGPGPGPDGGSCMSGEVTCFGDVVYYCWSGSWQYSYGCGIGQTCVAGACVGGASDAGYPDAGVTCRTGDSACNTSAQWTLAHGQTSCADTSQAADDVHTAGYCGLPDLGVGAPDHIWKFVAPYAGTYKVTVTPTHVWDVVLSVRGPNGCAQSTCQVGHGENRGWVGVSETVTFFADKAGDVFNIVVDGTGGPTDSAGPYTISIW